MISLYKSSFIILLAKNNSLWSCVDNKVTFNARGTAYFDLSLPKAKISRYAPFWFPFTLFLLFWFIRWVYLFNFEMRTCLCNCWYISGIMKSICLPTKSVWLYPNILQIPKDIFIIVPIVEGSAERKIYSNSSLTGRPCISLASLLSPSLNTAFPWISLKRLR